MSESEGLYNVFTGSGVLPTHWSASGVRTNYDPETKDLVFDMPKGWTDTMSQPEVITRRELWEKIDDPTYRVDYFLEIGTTPEESEPFSPTETKLVVTEHDDGTTEFRTNIDFESVRNVARGSDLSISLRARAKVGKGDPVRIPLIKGRARVPEETLWLGENTPGFFFVVDGGLVLSFHTLVDDLKGTLTHLRVTHVSFSGKLKHMDEWFVNKNYDMA